MKIEMSPREVEIVEIIVENVLFDNGYDIKYDPYLKELYEIKQKLNQKMTGSESKDSLIN